MRKISALVAHLQAATGLPLENIHAYADKGELAPSGRHLGSVIPEGDGPAREQVEIGVWKYDAVIQIERYPSDGPTLLAIVLAWLADVDLERDGLADPEVDAEINDLATADIEIAVEFEERIVIIEDPDGGIHFRGRPWSVRPEPDIAEARSVALGNGHAG